MTPEQVLIPILWIYIIGCLLSLAVMVSDIFRRYGRDRD